jgi:hypothetical protein
MIKSPPRALLSAALACLVGLILLTIVAGDGRAADDGYLFAYFKGNGEDGLLFAHSRDGLTWQSLRDDRSFLKPEVSRDKLMRDPHITLGPDGVYHLVWTSSWSEAVIGHATSKDLVNWSEQQSIRPLETEPTAANVWAPETFYDARAKQFIIFWSTTIPGRFPETAKSADNGRNHRIYSTTTKDFRTFTPARVLYDGGFNVIDATIVEDAGRFVMFLKDETLLPTAQKNIRFATSARAEGPSAINIGGRWIVYFDKYRDRRYGAIASTDLKQWEDISEKVSFPAGARHGTVLRAAPPVIAKLLSLK